MTENRRLVQAKAFASCPISCGGYWGGFANSPDVPAGGLARGSSTVCTQAIEESMEHPG
jgi:hypothetical protein